MSRLVTILILFLVPGIVLGSGSIVLTDTTEEVVVDKGDVGVWIDSSNQVGFQEVRSLPDSAFDWQHSMYNKFRQVNYWHKFKIESRASERRKWVLEILDSRHNIVELYTPQPSGGYKKHRTGLFKPFYKREYKHKNLIIDVPVQPDTAQWYYMKINTKVLGTFRFKLRSNQKFSSYAVYEYYILGIYYGVLIAFAIYNLLIYTSIRDKVYLYYIFYILAWVFFSMLDDGIGYQLLWPNTPEVNYIGFFLAHPVVVVFFVLYARRFLNIPGRFTRYNKLILTAAGVYLLYHTFFGKLGLDYIYNGLFLLPFALVFVVAVKAYRQGYKPARFFIAGIVFLLVGYITRFLKDQAVLDPLIHSETALIFVVYSRNLGFLLDTMVLSLALADRIRFIRRQQHEAQEETIKQLRINEELKNKVNRELEEKVQERTEQLEAKTGELSHANEKLREQAEQIQEMNKMLDLDNYKLKKKVTESKKERILLRDVSFEEFQEVFPDDLACMRFLSELKWEQGFVCKKCGNTEYWEGSKKFARRCTKCRYEESVTAYTLLHKCKFPLNKALYITLKVSRYGEEVNSYELSRELDLRRKTIWQFKQKVLTALEKSSKQHKKGSSAMLDSLLLQQIA